MPRVWPVLLLLLLLPVSLRAGEPPQLPFLRIEAGGHVGAIARLALNADGSLLATAGYDKTIRLWSLPDGAPRGVLRPPIGPREEGEIYAVALSPDGARVFAAGATGGTWDGSFAIYLFDAAHASFAGQLGGLPAPVTDLAVSSDGARLAAGLAQGGIREWDAHTGKPLFEDRAYAGPVRTVVFDRGGRLFTASADGKVRVYDAAGHKTAEAQTPSKLAPWGLALSPDGFLLAVTAESSDKAGRLHLDVVSSTGLAAVFTPDTTGLPGEGLLTASWARNDHGGVDLLAGGYAHGPGGYLVRRWPDFGLGPPQDLPVSHDTIRHMLPLPAGGVVFATEDPGWGVMAPDGTLARAPAPPMADLRPSHIGGLAVSDDGATLHFATSTGGQLFSLADRSLAADPQPVPLRRHDAPGLALTGWLDSNAPSLNGARLKLDRTEFTRDATVLPDGSAVLLATDTHLRLFGRDQRQIAAVEVPAAAWAVAVSPGGKVAIAALLDGSLRWYGLGPGEMLVERAALFAHADGRRWVLFTPAGLFDDSDLGGDDLVGVQLNRARNQAPQWLSFSQAFRILYAPDAVHASVTGRPAPASVVDLGTLRERLDKQTLIELKTACLIDAQAQCAAIALSRGIRAAGPGAMAATGSQVRLSAKLTDRGLGLGPVDVFINDRNAGRQSPAGDEVTADVTLTAGENRITLRAYDASGTIFTETPPLRLTQEAPADAETAPRLFVLAIGIDHYANTGLDLRYAVADAKRLTADITRVATPLFGAPDVTLLTTPAETTKAAILETFERLSHQIRPQDVFLFYVASHGAVDEDTNRFILVPSDMKDISSWHAMTLQAIDETTLVSALSRIQAQDALLLLDTCHSGKVTADNLANVGHESGRFLLAASGSVQEALDSYDDRNGVFVYAMDEAFSGRAGHDGDGNLGALALGEYVARRVGQLARTKHHEQDAVFRAAQRELHSFPIARVSTTPP